MLLLLRQLVNVFSTSVEVIPATSPDGVATDGILHECGGDPSLKRYKYHQE